MSSKFGNASDKREIDKKNEPTLLKFKSGKHQARIYLPY